jgi:hypothetical protein
MTSGSLTIGNTSQNYGGGQGWNASTAGLMFECTDTTEIAIHDSGASIHSLLYYASNGKITIGRNMGWNEANVGIGKTPDWKLDVNGHVHVGNNRFLLSTFNETGARQFVGKQYNGEILGGMEIENTTLGGNYSQKVHFTTHHYGVSWGRRMTITENGDVSIASNNLSVGGASIQQIIKNQHLFSLYRVSITWYNGITSYWEGVWDFETNLKFNEYNRPQLNVRWNISGSINNGNGNDSNKYFFMNYFYNQLGNNIAFNTTHSYGTWFFQNYWGSQGNNFLRIICRLDAPADYLNVNIS